MFTHLSVPDVLSYSFSNLPALFLSSTWFSLISLPAGLDLKTPGHSFICSNNRKWVVFKLMRIFVPTLPGVCTPVCKLEEWCWQIKIKTGKTRQQLNNIICKPSSAWEIIQSYQTQYAWNEETNWIGQRVRQHLVTKPEVHRVEGGRHNQLLGHP